MIIYFYNNINVKFNINNSWGFIDYDPGLH